MEETIPPTLLSDLVDFVRILFTHFTEGNLFLSKEFILHTYLFLTNYLKGIYWQQTGLW